jgi:hypothetical protein
VRCFVAIVGTVCLVAAACGTERPNPDERPEQIASVPAAEEPAPTPEPTSPDTPVAPASAAPERAPEDRATLAVGDDFSCAVHAAAVWCWGDATKGQLGLRARRAGAANGPVRVAQDAVAVAAGEAHACAILATGRATCWGTREGATRAALPAQLASIEVLGVSAGGGRSCVRSVHGDILCVEPDGTVDTRPLPGPMASAVQVGGHHACARFLDGRVHCWGDDLRGGLGASQATGVRRLALGSTHTCALLPDGVVRCWGDLHPDRRQSTAIPGPFDRATDAASVAVGGMHTCVFLGGGDTRCTDVVQERVWPSGARGRAVSPEVVLPDGTVEVALGRSHHCVRDAAGAVSCWGNDDHAQSSGTTGEDYRAEPVSVPLP